MKREKRYDCSCFRPVTFVMATVLVMTIVLSGGGVVDLDRHCSAGNNPKGRHSQIAPVLTLPVWLDHQRLQLSSGRSKSASSLASILTANVQPPPGKGGCTYDCGPTTLGPQKSRRISPLVPSFT
jgi:hypothetical protein